MADKTPDGLDEFLTDADPQSAVAAQGLQKIGSAVGSSLEQQYQEGQQRLQAASGPLSDPNTKAALMGLGEQAAAGTIGESSGAIPKLAKTLGHELAPGVANATELLAKAQAAFEQGQVDHTAVAFAIQRLKTAERLANKKGYSQGGQVQSFNQGGTTAPEGLDAFLAQPDSPAMPGQVTNQLAGNSTPGLSPGLDTNTPGNTPAGLDDFVAPELYGTGSQQAVAGLEGFGRGVLGPLSTLAETKLLGVKPEDILAREKANPITAGAGEVAGLVAPGLLTGGASTLGKFTVAGALNAATKGLTVAKDATLAARIGVPAAKVAIENMLIQGSDETSKMILNDPQQTAQTAIAHIGLAGAIGATLGGAGAAASSLWAAKAESSVGSLAKDFKNRINEHIDNPDKAASVYNELNDLFTHINIGSDGIYGANGIKSQDITKLLSEKPLNVKMIEKTQEVADTFKKTITKMAEDPYTYPPRLTKMLQADANNFASMVSTDELSSSKAFEAIQELKQTVASYAKYKKRVAPFAEEHGFVKLSDTLARELKETLEDTSLWGPAANRQKQINEAFHEFLPSFDDLKSKFTSLREGEPVMDPAKVATYVKQLDSPRAEIKKEVLKNIIEKWEKYNKVINQSHANLGIDALAEGPALGVTKRTFDKVTTGQKLADWVVEKGLSKAAGAGAGASIGVAAGAPVGLPASLSALFGAAAAGPLMTSVINGIAKSIVRGENITAKSMKAAVDAGTAAFKADKVINNSTISIFRGATSVLPRSMMPTAVQKAKLDKLVAQSQHDPSVLLTSNTTDTSGILPGYSEAHSQTLGQVMTYLNNLRPDNTKQSPLDSAQVASTTAKAKYDNALAIAQQPLYTLEKMANGTLTTEDMIHMAAMYPALLNKTRQKVFAQIVDTKSKGKMIPYNRRMAASIFMGQPLDSTMLPASILATQIVPGYQKQANEQQQAGNAPGGKVNSQGASAMAKTSQMYMTPTQARMNHAQTKR